MGKIAEIMLLQRAPQPALLCEYTVSEAELTATIGLGFMKISAYLQELGILPADFPFVIYPDYEHMRPESLRVVIGFKTTTALPARKDIESVIWPECKIVTCLHRGDYNELGQLYLEMAQWIKTNGYKQEGSSYEYYYTGPNVPIYEQVTRVEMLLL